MGWQQTESSPSPLGIKELRTAVSHRTSAEWSLLCREEDAEPQAGACREEAEGRGD